ncbi:MAG TPA: hypothetical protein VND64_17835 [Pirellulales bacterium]|nr:hypothetical protein [Pirellulales bacterium]
MRRPSFQFRISTLLWITAVVAGFFCGIHWNRRQLLIEREESKANRVMWEFIDQGHNQRWSELLKEFDYLLERGRIRPNDEARQLRAEIEKARQPIVDQFPPRRQARLPKN